MARRIKLSLYNHCLDRFKSPRFIKILNIWVLKKQRIKGAGRRKKDEQNTRLDSFAVHDPQFSTYCVTAVPGA